MRGVATVSERGLTLVEVLVVLVIMGVVLTGISTVFTTGQKEFANREASIRMQQQARLAMMNIEKDLRMAGYGLMDIGNLQINTNFTDSPWAVLETAPVAATAAGTDTFSIRYLQGDPEPEAMVASGSPQQYAKEVRLVSPSVSSAPSDDTLVSSSAMFKEGDFYLVNDRTDFNRPASLLQVTTVSAGQLAHKPNSPFNPSGGKEMFPSGGYPAGARVLNLGADRLRQAGYYIDTNRNLVRWQKSDPAPDGPIDSRIVAGGIEDLQLKYQLADAPAVWQDSIAKSEVAKLRAVKLSIIARSGKPDPTYKSAEVFKLGGAYGNGASYSGGGYRRLILSTTIHLRNLAMRP